MEQAASSWSHQCKAFYLFMDSKRVEILLLAESGFLLLYFMAWPLALVFTSGLLRCFPSMSLCFQPWLNAEDLPSLSCLWCRIATAEA